jgi:hypothetical protein
VPQYILFQLYLQDIQSVIIEGGAHTLKAFIDAGLWDEARIFTGASVLSDGIKAPVVSGTNAGEYARLGPIVYRFLQIYLYNLSTMLYVFLSICCSVIVSVLLKLARRYQIDVFQAITWNY